MAVGVGMVQYVLELFFDEASDARIRAVWKRIARKGFPTPLNLQAYEPHLTLLVDETPEMDVASLVGDLQRWAQGWRPFSVDLVYLGLFVDRTWLVFFGAAPSQVLLETHRLVYDIGSRYMGAIRDYFAPELWVPHVTLSFDLQKEQAQNLLALDWQGTLPLRIQVRGLRLVEVHNAGARERFRYAFPGV